MKDILEIEENRENFRLLIERKKELVPFVGAGFSKPACPTWVEFLELFCQELKSKKMLKPSAEEDYEKIKASREENRLEEMANFLANKAGKREYQNILKKYFNKSIQAGMERKFELFHKAFPNLKITTNYDTLIESNGPKSNYVNTFYGNQPDDLNRLFSCMNANCLLKIHGATIKPDSIVFAREEYDQIYGESSGFDSKAPFPSFLERVFTNSTVLFIGCSLGLDRTVMILQSLINVREHFAIMSLPGNDDTLADLKLHLSQLNIAPIWITDYSQVETLLAELAGENETPKEKTHPQPAANIGHDKGVKFIGREAQLKKMEAIIKRGTGSIQTITGKLFNIDGAGGIGKTTLAIEAAKRFGSYFIDGVIGPIRIPGYTPMSFAMELARRIGVKEDEPDTVEKARALINRLLKERNALIILDNVEEWEPFLDMLPETTCSTIIVTTRDRDIHNRIKDTSQIPEVEEIRLDRFTKEEVFELFKMMLREEYKPEEETHYDQIASSVGYLPIALRQAIALLKYGPHYKPAKLVEKFSREDPLRLLNEGAEEVGLDKRTIERVYDLSSKLLDDRLMQVLKSIAVCRPGPVPLFFLERMTRDSYIEQRVEKLFTYSWIETRDVGDKGEKYYEMHQLVRELVRQKCKKQMPFTPFLDAVDSFFLDKKVHFEIKDRLMLQMEEALDVAKSLKDKRMIRWMYELGPFSQSRGHGEFYVRLTEVVEELFSNDKGALRTAYAHRALIYWGWGRNDEAMVLLKQDERIKEELGDRAGLAASYGNQALILSNWGRIDEAMSLYIKAELICKELGDKKGLAASYCNQASILSDWGRLDEAMALNKKDEAICEELGDRGGLAASYGNQASILRDWGRLDEAMALHKKEEKIKEELGDRAGLATSYGNQALILRDLGRFDDAMVLYKRQESIRDELGDRAGLGRCYHNQAHILRKQEKYDEALALHQKEETIFTELRMKSALAECRGEMALVYLELNDIEKAFSLADEGVKTAEELNNKIVLEKNLRNLGLVLAKAGEIEKQKEVWTKAIALRKEMKMPTEKQEKELEAIAKC